MWLIKSSGKSFTQLLQKKTFKSLLVLLLSLTLLSSSVKTLGGRWFVMRGMVILLTICLILILLKRRTTLKNLA